MRTRPARPPPRPWTRRRGPGLFAAALLVGAAAAAACGARARSLAARAAPQRRANGDGDEARARLWASCENDRCEPWESVESCPWDCQPARGAVELPNLAVFSGQAPARAFRQCFQPAGAAPAAGQAWEFGDDGRSAVTIRYLGDEAWEATVRNTSRAVPITRVAFPWRPEPYCLGEDCGDDRPDAPWRDNRVYYGQNGGLVAGEIGGLFTWGPHDLAYPGGFFSPIVVIADNRRALLVAATNWPPQRVSPRHTGRQTAFFYDAPIPPGESRTFSAVIATVAGNAAAGYHPWQIAVRRYTRWLDARAPRPTYPAWLEASDGFLNVQLQNYLSGEAARRGVERLYTEWRDTLDAVLFWGQMSNYAGPAAAAVPALLAGERTGCCVPSPAMHPRYQPWLPDFVRRITADPRRPFRAGYYAVVRDGLVEPDDAAFLRDWHARNRREYGANAFYTDVVGRGYMGDPPTAIARFADGTIPEDSVIEGFVDVYPRAGLLSGAVMGAGAGWPGGPDALPARCRQCTFVNLARFVMGDRLGFFGESNGEWINARPDPRRPERAFWSHRQMFLLGLKADVVTPVPIVREIVALRRRHRFWARRPRYLDTVGLTEIPAGIDVRRFDTRDGATLLVVDNPYRRPLTRLRLRGRAVALPADPLAIVEVTR